MYFEICSGNVRKWYDQRRVCKAFLCIKLSFFTRRFQSCKNRNVGSLHCLVASGVIKLGTAENIAGSVEIFLLPKVEHLPGLSW